jgi:RNA-directed DNA polymerase
MTPIDDVALFGALFSPAALETVFKEEFASTTGKGVDRLNGFQFSFN